MPYPHTFRPYCPLAGRLPISTGSGNLNLWAFLPGRWKMRAIRSASADRPCVFGDDGDWLDADLAVTLGGHIGVAQEDVYPFLRQELPLIKARLASGRPVADRLPGRAVDDSGVRRAGLCRAWMRRAWKPGSWGIAANWPRAGLDSRRIRKDALRLGGAKPNRHFRRWLTEETV